MTNNVNPSPVNPHLRARLKELMMLLPSDRLATEVDILVQEIKQDQNIPKTPESSKQDEISEKLSLLLKKIDEVLSERKEP